MYRYMQTDTYCSHPTSRWVQDPTFSRGLLHQVHDIRVILVLSNVPGIAHDVLTSMGDMQ